MRTFLHGPRRSFLRIPLLILPLLLSNVGGKPILKKGETEELQVTAKSAVLKNINDSVSIEVQEAAAAGPESLQQANPKALKVCIMTADFWGLKSAGGTATAYHLLAAVLAKDPRLHVTFLGVTKKETLCKNARSINQQPNLDWECLEAAHFLPEIVETYPYQQLSHAVLKWFREDMDRCDVIHGHEWGGIFIDLVTAAYLRDLKPGLRMSIEPHGGHFWSSQGQVQRPMDPISLRIDNQERMVNMLNDEEISPTNYMLAFLRQRAWKLPEKTVTIPNIIPEVDPQTEALMGKEKPIWRLAFFSRLEERKGIKFFVDAISQLDVSNIPNFEVFFVGSEAKIDMRPSGVWLKEKTAKWSFKTHLKIGVPRDEALDILSSEGTLLVLCSLIDNMPYVVAEAAVKGIPFLAFDAGGVLEMFDGKIHKDNVVLEPTLAALTAKLKQVLEKGSIKSVRLNEKVTSGREQWLNWHKGFAAEYPRLMEEDEKLRRDAAEKTKQYKEPAEVVRLLKEHHALDLWEGICQSSGAMADRPPILLLPEGYEFNDKQEDLLKDMGRLYKMNELRGGKFGAMAFGSVVPSGKVSYPTSPTWMSYNGDDSKCMDDIPILLRPELFCQSFLAEARVFRITNFTSYGYSCMPDKVPVDRQISFAVASNLYKDSEELLRNLHLAPYLKPVVSLIDDFPTHQRHKGWQFGYLVNDTAKQIQWLSWKNSESGLLRDGAWTCSLTQHDYPTMHHSLLHPCAGDGQVCCGNSQNAPFLLRYESFFHSKAALLVLAYEVWPICGDGLDFVVRLTPSGPRKPAILLKRSYEADPKGTPNRQKIEWRLHIRTGDIIDFLVNPRGNHDCDGVYIVDIQIWTDNELL